MHSRFIQGTPSSEVFYASLGQHKSSPPALQVTDPQDDLKWGGFKFTSWEGESKELKKKKKKLYYLNSFCVLSNTACSLNTHKTLLRHTGYILFPF